MTPRGISADISRPVRRPPVRRGVLPVPAGLPTRARQAPRRPQPAPASANANASSRSRSRSRRHLWELAQYPLIAGLALAASSSSTLGQILVALYGVVVIFLRRQSSALSFGIALLILIAIPVFSLIGQPGIAENAAIYVYELLVIGTIQAILELRQTT